MRIRFAQNLLLSVVCIVTIGCFGMAAQAQNSKKNANNDRTGQATYGSSEFKSIRFKSQIPCYLELKSWDKPKASFEWFILFVQDSREGAGQPDSNSAPAVLLAKEGGDLVVRLAADPTRFTARAPMAGESKGGVLIEDMKTGTVWRVVVRATVPHDARIDTYEFEGPIYFPEGPDRGNTLPPPQRRS